MTPLPPLSVNAVTARAETNTGDPCTAQNPGFRRETWKVDFVKALRDPSLSLLIWGRQRLMRAEVSFLEANALNFL